MSKRHVAYIKPDEPSFLKKLKKQAGYIEGPTVDTKREQNGDISEDDLLDTEEEQPTVVVLKSGDLTAEEAKLEEERLKKLEEETPADLSVPVVFQAPKKQKTEIETKSSKKIKPSTKNKGNKIKNKTLLSFDEEDNDD